MKQAAKVSRVDCDIPKSSLSHLQSVTKLYQKGNQLLLICVLDTQTSNYGNKLVGLLPQASTSKIEPTAGVW